LLADGRLAATGSAERGKPAAAWLRSGSVSTSRGAKTPILTDTERAIDALQGLMR
jgi:hypothetical protein